MAGRWFSLRLNFILELPLHWNRQWYLLHTKLPWDSTWGRWRKDSEQSTVAGGEMWGIRGAWVGWILDHRRPWESKPQEFTSMGHGFPQDLPHKSWVSSVKLLKDGVKFIWRWGDTGMVWKWPAARLDGSSETLMVEKMEESKAATERGCGQASVLL